MCGVVYWISMLLVGVFFFKQKTAYEMRISDWSSDVCSSDLVIGEKRDVAMPFGKRRDADHDFGQPVIKILAEAAVLDHLIEVLMSRTQIGRASCRVRVGQYV